RLLDPDVVELADDGPQHPAGAGLIVDDENPHVRNSAYPRSDRGAGISMPNTVRPSSRRTPMFQPNARTRRCVTASPRPMLPFLVLTKGSKIAAPISSAIPGPSSHTSRTIAPSPLGRERTPTADPA